MPETLSLPPSRWGNAASAGVFALLAVLAALEAITDVADGVPVWNVFLDITLTAGALGTGTFFLWRFIRIRRQTRELLVHLGIARADAEHWRYECAQILPALGEAILRQFERWSLTPEEQEIALLVLQGLPADEIATRRGSTSLGIQTHISEIFRKANVSSASALSAYFLRDLLFLAGEGLRRRSRTSLN